MWPAVPCPVERGVAVGDVQFDRQDGVPHASTRGASAFRSRAVAATESPRSRAASVHTRHVQAWPSRYGALAKPTYADAAAQRATVVEAVRRLTTT
ncbi:hypothetical protein [Nonomuraea sp. NEAU-A123]|uniref:hypothetical protein n=1 Tax=Nonomuraea sp. NEAU-A123 TaxID=2839649 RepID=UPI001BE43C15|nr:hypothetical protein [Nonomuraea sp. NEAU-A123]MBT2232273.1 hypothetical protein [Nonomuraea sp. NEAU-A123]